MNLDIVVNLGEDIRFRIDNVKVTIANNKTTLVSDDLQDLLTVGQVFQAVTFVSYRFIRRTLVVHSYNPENGGFACAELYRDKGSFRDPSVAADYEAWAYQKEEAEDA